MASSEEVSSEQASRNGDNVARDDGSDNDDGPSQCLGDDSDVEDTPHQQEERDADELDLLDSLPLEDDDAADEFFEAIECEEID